MNLNIAIPVYVSEDSTIIIRVGGVEKDAEALNFFLSFVLIIWEEPELKLTMTGDTHGLQPTDLCHCLLSLQLEPQKDDSNKNRKEFANIRYRTKTFSSYHGRAATP